MRAARNQDRSVGGQPKLPLQGFHLVGVSLHMKGIVLERTQVEDALLPNTSYSKPSGVYPAAGTAELNRFPESRDQPAEAPQSVSRTIRYSPVNYGHWDTHPGARIHEVWPDFQLYQHHCGRFHAVQTVFHAEG
jgi:hypothetical protein